jgi:hypothetical protein
MGCRIAHSRCPADRQRRLAERVGAVALDPLRRRASKYEEGHTMTAFLWITALACWSIAALLIVGVVGPSFLEPLRLARQFDEEPKAE